MSPATCVTASVRCRTGRSRVCSSATSRRCFLQALTNTIIEVPTFDNRLLSVPVNQIVSPGYVKTVKGEGMPIPDAGEKGDLVIRFSTKFPDTLTPDVKAALKKLL